MYKIKTQDVEIYSLTAEQAFEDGKKLIQYHSFDSYDDEVDILNDYFYSFLKNKDHFGADIKVFSIQVDKVE